MELNLYQLRIFHKVAQRLSFSKAAEELLLSQPAVSRQVDGLEKAIGVPLFARVGRGIVLTEAGRRLYECADSMMEWVRQAEQLATEFTQPAAGRVAVGAVPSWGQYRLPPLLNEFKRRQADALLSVRLGESRALQEQVLGGELDLAVITAPVAVSNLQVEPYQQESWVLVVVAGHGLLEGEFRPARLKTERLLMDSADKPLCQAVQRQLERWQVEPEEYIALQGTETLLQAVASGLGVAFVARSAAEVAARHGQVAVVADAAVEGAPRLMICTAKGRRLSPSCLAFRSYLLKARDR